MRIGRARAEGKQTELHVSRCVSALFSLAVLPLPHPWLCWSYGFGCTSNPFPYSFEKGTDFLDGLRYAPSRS